MPTMMSLPLAALAAFALAWLSAVAGFGGGVLLRPVSTALFGLRRGRHFRYLDVRPDRAPCLHPPSDVADRRGLGDGGQSMNLWQALLLGIVEGITEFLPVSSTGHLTIVEKLLGLPVDDAGVTAFTAIVQVGAIAAVIVYFRTDIMRLLVAWLRGLRARESRAEPEYQFAWYVIIGSIPIGIVGFLARDLISGDLRNLWVVVVALVAWSAVMWWAERTGQQNRHEVNIRARDSIFIGLMQCVALVPGVSRSGATISAGLLRDLDRVAATRMSFFLSIPALVAAGAYEGVSEAAAVSTTIGWGPTLAATAISFVVAYASIAWLLRLVAGHSITVFIGYRLGLAALLAAALSTGVLAAT